MPSSLKGNGPRTIALGARDSIDRPAGTSHSSIHPMSEGEFALFQALIFREAGIYLSTAKKALLVGRLTRRLRELGLTSFFSYYRRIQEDSEERICLFDAVCTNETHFFREPKHFEFLEERIFPQWAAQAAAGERPRQVRAWSAASSSGEEPFSICMSLLSHFPRGSGWHLEVLGTDLSTRALRKASAGIWPVQRAAEIPDRYLKQFMLQGKRSNEGQMKAGREIRSLTRFQRLNLNDNLYPVVGKFDLIFCRNVMIYFNAESRARTIDKLLNHLSPSGYLFLGHAETLNGSSDRVRAVMPTVYAPVIDSSPASTPARLQTL